MRRNELSGSIRTEGALLPADLLKRVQAADPSLPGLDPAAYHLPGNMRLNEAASRAWNALLGAWQVFQEARRKLPTGETGTSVTRQRWLLPLFQELGYGRLAPQTAVQLDSRTYPVSHGYGHVPIHLVGCNIDLDRRSAGVVGAAEASPHSLVQQLLNRDAERLWGFVSNGLVLRILRDNLSLTRQAFVEFDLEAMFEGEAYSDFVLLFLTLHQSRVEAEKAADTHLEAWSQEAQNTGTRALEGLRSGVENAINALGRGFLRDAGLRSKLQEGDLEPADYYRQLLRLVYRLLFLFVAEDRDLLHPETASETARDRYLHYSTGRLREVAAGIRGGRHPDLYESLKTVMRVLGEGGAPGLGLPELGGFLFSERATPDLFAACLPNAFLLQAVRALAYREVDGVRRPVDYRNLGSEELGSVYESLLELHPEIDTRAGQFKLASAAGNERKTTGSYYTPSSLINLLLDSALDPVIDRAVKYKTAEEAEEALLGLRIVDPASGSGHFLIAASQRLGKRLAAIRTGDEEPAPGDVRQAVRDVVGRCIYGVDLNEMAAELCKVALWMEALEPGKPLAFLEHRIQVGNSLLGTTRELVRKGIPDDAFKPIEGDDRSHARDVRKINKEERAGQSRLFAATENDSAAELAAAFARLAAMPSERVEDIRAKEEEHERLQADARLAREKLAFDAWCAAFVWPKTPDAPLAVTTGTVTELREAGELSSEQKEQLNVLAEQYAFFHWELAFPEIFAGGRSGFDVVLGNPPWERVKLQEKEWFATRDPEVAAARNASERRKMIQELEVQAPALHKAFLAARRAAEGASHFARNSGKYPLTGKGDINTYPLFAELGRNLAGRAGRTGLVLPSGIASDNTTKEYFQDLIEGRRLVSLFDFENRQGIFPGVHRSYKFCLLTLTGTDHPATEAEFVFFALQPADVNDPEKRFTLTPEDIELLNPNTKTAPVFRTRRDAEITKGIYRRVPVLVNETTGENPWGVSFMRMFDMSNDSGLFRTREQLEAEGYVLDGNRFTRDGTVTHLPLYEAKMMHQFDHRFATYESDGKFRDVTEEEKQDPEFVPMPRYWVEKELADARQLGTHKHGPFRNIGFRNVARNSDIRTGLFTVVPKVAAGNSLPILSLRQAADVALLLQANLSSFACDYVTRQKIAGSNMNFFFVEQLAVLAPGDYDASDLEFIVARTMELICTANDLLPVNVSEEYPARPFVWNGMRRFRIRAELDALYFHLYGIERDDVDYMMESFPIVKRKDLAEYGSYRTKEAILEIYDEMARCEREGTQYVTRLDPPPASPQLSEKDGSHVV